MFTDQPIKNESEDKFGRANFAKRIAQVIASRQEKESIVIGLHAPWGEGKTSVINMIIEELRQYSSTKSKIITDGHILTIKFNPWRFPNETQLLMSFFFTLAETVEKSIKNNKQKIGEKFKKYAWLTSPLDTVKLSLGGVIDAKLETKETLEKLGEELSKTDIEKLKEEIENVLDQENRRIVVIMDDIDRLNKEEIQAVFRLVKLTADFSNIAYILAFDIDRVADALTEQYGSKEAGLSFLEKIIQVSLPLPPATSESLRTMAYEELDRLLANCKIELSETETRIFAGEFQTAFDSKLKNPRLVKRYINRLTFLFPILQNEVSVIDLMLIEAIHVFYPNLYELIRDNSMLFLGDTSGWESDSEKDQRKNILRNEVDSFPERERKNVKRIITRLFPKTEGILGNTHYGNDWHSAWAKEKKVASPDYFLRYFNYGIPIKDISDIEIRDFVKNLKSQTNEKNAEKVKQIISKSKEDLFLRKLGLMVDLMSEDEAIALTKTIAISGDLFSRQDIGASFFGTEPFSRACILIRDCLKQLKDLEERDRIALELIKIASPLDFASTYFRWNHSFKDNDGNIKKIFISVECEEEMLDYLISRIKDEAKIEPLEKRYLQKSSRLYSDWYYRDLESLKKYLKDRFKKNPNEVEDFIRSFAKQSYEINSTVKSYGFDFIISAIEKSNPQLTKTESNEYLDYDEIESGEKFLQQFLNIYRRNKENAQIKNI